MDNLLDLLFGLVLFLIASCVLAFYWVAARQVVFIEGSLLGVTAFCALNLATGAVLYREWGRRHASIPATTLAVSSAICMVVVMVMYQPGVG